MPSCALACCATSHRSLISSKVKERCLSHSFTCYDNLYHSSALPQGGIFFVVSTLLRARSPVVPLRTVLWFRQKSKNAACRTHLPATTICTTLRLCHRVVFLFGYVRLVRAFVLARLLCHFALFFGFVKSQRTLPVALTYLLRQSVPLFGFAAEWYFFCDFELFGNRVTNKT